MPTLALVQTAVEGRTLPSQRAGLGVPLTVEISTMSRPCASLPTTTNRQVRQLLDLTPAGRRPGPAPSPGAVHVRLKKPRKVAEPVAWRVGKNGERVGAQLGFLCKEGQLELAQRQGWRHGHGQRQGSPARGQVAVRPTERTK